MSEWLESFPFREVRTLLRQAGVPDNVRVFVQVHGRNPELTREFRRLCISLKGQNFVQYPIGQTLVRRIQMWGTQFLNDPQAPRVWARTLSEGDTKGLVNPRASPRVRVKQRRKLQRRLHFVGIVLADLLGRALRTFIVREHRLTGFHQPGTQLSPQARDAYISFQAQVLRNRGKGEQDCYPQN